MIAASRLAQLMSLCQCSVMNAYVDKLCTVTSRLVAYVVTQLQLVGTTRQGRYMHVLQSALSALGVVELKARYVTTAHDSYKSTIPSRNVYELSPSANFASQLPRCTGHGLGVMAASRYFSHFEVIFDHFTWHFTNHLQYGSPHT